MRKVDGVMVFRSGRAELKLRTDMSANYHRNMMCDITGVYSIGVNVATRKRSSHNTVILAKFRESDKN